MPESGTQHNLETIFHKKILLYRSLLDCLKKERENLIQVDLNALWDISKVKEGLVAKIMTVRRQMGSVIKTSKEQEMPSFSDMMEAIPDDKKEGFQGLFHTVRMLKGEVEAYRKENVHFMDESLQFIDELISITTGVTYARNIYNNQCQLKRTSGNMLLQREV